MLRERPQPEEGSVSHLPDWPPLLAACAQHSSNSTSGNGSGPATQHTESTEVVLGSQRSRGQQGGAGLEHGPGFAPVSNSFPASVPSQRGNSSDTVARCPPSGLHLEFRDVSFRYTQSAGANMAPGANVWRSGDFSAAAAAAVTAAPAANAPMQLQSISFTLQPGEALGIVGPPGESLLMHPAGGMMYPLLRCT
jgi:ABC-type multidrug transport system fused ATPase/permease subunit